MIRRGACVGLVSLSVLSGARSEALAQGSKGSSLLSTRYGRQLGGRSSSTPTSDSMGRSVLEVGVVAALIEDRAKALGLRAMAQAMKDSTLMASPRVSAVLEQGAGLLSSTAGAKSAEGLVRTLLNLVLAEHLVAGLIENDATALATCARSASEGDPKKARERDSEALFSLLQAKGPFRVEGASLAQAGGAARCLEAVLADLTTAVALVSREKKPSLALAWELGDWNGTSIATVGENAELDTVGAIRAVDAWKPCAIAHEAAQKRPGEARPTSEQAAPASCGPTSEKGLVDKGLGTKDIEALVRQLRALGPMGERAGPGGTKSAFAEMGELSTASALARVDQLVDLDKGLRAFVKALDQTEWDQHPLLQDRPKLLAFADTSVRLKFLLEELAGLAGVSELFPVPSEPPEGGGSVGQPTMLQVAQQVRRLAPALRVLRPLLSFKVAAGSRGELPVEAALRLLADAGTGELVRATGFEGTLDECSEGRAPQSGKQPSTAQRWACTVISAVTDSLTVSGSKVQLDATTATKRLARLGDGMRAGSGWRPFFHLTVGTGVMFAPSMPIPGGSLRQDRWSPVVAEQIGVGVASPPLLGGAMTLKAGAFASGILYRAVVDSVESDAFHLGPFLAVDLYELLELHVSPSLMVNPALGDSSTGFGLVLGAQVPLGDFLSRL